MEEKIEDIEKIVQFWLDSADENLKTMTHLVDSKDYSWALFLGHLVIEKTLKALYVKRLQKHAFFSHDLLRLADKIDIELSEDFEEWLDVITTFNLNARYDSYKQEFHKLCTKDFADTWLNRIERIQLWLRSQL
ncbi:MAG: HEPN domain-containing protein [Bacteroidales bacterium]